MPEEEVVHADGGYVGALLEEIHARLGGTLLPQDLRSRFPEIADKPGQDLEAEHLRKYPELQQSLAFIVHYSPSKWLLEQESPHLAALRRFHFPDRTIEPYHRQTGELAKPQEERRDIYDWARENQLKGICFSGGGIRSATFNLGILQGLAKQNLLKEFDYLSSVSGGGYIHSWLAAWLKRKALEFRDDKNHEYATQEDAQSAFNHVTYRLTPLPVRKDDQRFQTVWPRQIQWLRRYSNYLTPHVGLLTSDTWSAVAIWTRNVSLNQTLLTSIFLSILCLPHLLVPSVRLTNISNPITSSKDWRSCGWFCPVAPTIPAGVAENLPAYSVVQEFEDYFQGNWSREGVEHFCSRLTSIHGETVVALLCFVIGTVIIGLLLRAEYQLGKCATPKTMLHKHPWLREQQVFLAYFMLLLLMIFALLLTVAVSKHRRNIDFPASIFVLLVGLTWTETFSGGALGHLMTQRTQYFQRRKEDPRRSEKSATAGRVLALMALGLPAAAVGAVGSAGIAALLQSWIPLRIAQWLSLSSPCSVQIFAGTLLFFWLVPMTMIIVSGLIGKDFPEWLGEWLGRIRGYSLLMGIWWIAWCGPALLMPAVLIEVHLHTHKLIKWPALIAWIGTTAVSVMGGRSAKISGKDDDSAGLAGGLLNVIILAGPYVYIGGLVLILSLLLELVHEPMARRLFGGSDLIFWFGVIAACWTVAALLGFRLDINEYSMHTLYRNRLTRCYLGASNLMRSPSPVTGFDERDTDNLQLAHMTLNNGYPGPIPLFCCAMNITMGEELAWQERKAASFAFTPYYCGYDIGWTGNDRKIRYNGFTPTEFLYDGSPDQAKNVAGPNIATVMAASGAAVSPNMGYHTNPATAFLMTMFDVRLGLWIPNPRRSNLAGEDLSAAPTEIDHASPTFAPWWLTSELRGCVTDTSKYVYISDGGHFDNMGLYELVRRRCYHIVVCDAEEDGDYSYEGIGNAIRRCRIDFGVEISLDLTSLTPNTHSRLSPAHIISGTVRYPETPLDAASEGKIVYIKASLTGKVPADPNNAPTRGNVELPNVPGDVQNYKLQHAHFPHDSTAEQWFTESQFESYRRLGQSIIDGSSSLISGVLG